VLSVTGLRGYFRLAGLLDRSADIPLLGAGGGVIGNEDDAPT
jgi:hypothetical protein